MRFPKTEQAVLEETYYPPEWSTERGLLDLGVTWHWRFSMKRYQVEEVPLRMTWCGERVQCGPPRRVVTWEKIAGHVEMTVDVPTLTMMDDMRRRDMVTFRVQQHVSYSIKNPEQFARLFATEA